MKAESAIQEIEMEFDRLLLKEDYINPVRYLATKHIRPTKENGGGHSAVF